MQLDHIMFAANDLDTGIKHIEDLTGVRAEFGGSHPGGGTQNALLSFNDSQYLEIIAPDPRQSLKGNLGEVIARTGQPFIRTWAAATSDFDLLDAGVTAAGYRSRIVDMSRTRPDGIHLAWQLLFVEAHPFGMAMPFFINWLDSPHPATDAPGGCGLKSFRISTPLAEPFSRFCDAISLDAQISGGELSMAAELTSPAGEVVIGHSA